jgi:hypothetical protein
MERARGFAIRLRPSPKLSLTSVVILKEVAKDWREGVRSGFLFALN